MKNDNKKPNDSPQEGQNQQLKKLPTHVQRDLGLSTQDKLLQYLIPDTKPANA